MPGDINSFGQALEKYVELLSHPDDLKTLAEKTVELNKLAHSVMTAASPLLRTTATDLEHLLNAPVSVKDKSVSILEASEHYTENPSDLTALIDELRQNKDAFQLMRQELSILSTDAKKPQS